MGALRLLLAILVALSHMGISVAGHNPGVVAVFSFLAISGYVMTALIDKNYRQISSIPSFYLDRALRLYPQFLFYFVLSSLVIYFYLPASAAFNSLTWENIVPSLAIAPLGLYMFGITSPEIVPPAWSLGLEAFFYLIIPFLLIWKLRDVAFVISLVISLIAATGLINTDVWGYRLLPGVLFVFLCGSYVFHQEKKGRVLIIFAWGVYAVLFAFIKCGFVRESPSNVEIAMGVLIAIPAIYFFSQLGQHKIDEFLGNISYGVFLNHFVFIYLFQGLKMDAPYSSVRSLALLLALSFFTSFLSYFLVERPALRLRHKLRKARFPSSSSPA
ncbi:acyltransferase family protein [Herbaspirillum frisingense]|uniref:acyltransferase family protein n=1 Tax=Herbaspirillum frisingense TaxID=92645 RepID=UPI0039B10AFF